MIDSHVHADTRPYEDFEKMAITGIDTAVTCAHDPLKMSVSDVVFDHWNRILNNDIKRAAENGLKLYVALGIHPRSISEDFERALEKLPSFLENDSIVAIGEIGLETASESEKNIFKKQLQLAEALKMKVIVHTPRTNKKEITGITKSIIEENIDPKMVVIDHVDSTIVNDVIDMGAMLGLTVQPKKMTPDEAVSILEKYGFEKFSLDSDMSSSPSDPLSVPKTVHKIRLAGYNEKDIRKVSNDNAAKFFGL
ncbi:TatD family hydrolase [Methanobacterium sp.]|uniref:TatD family hydrolase n=1 Tax=Methanobacterium sp. TaxID=2164 RepID=UPI003C781F01